MQALLKTILFFVAAWLLLIGAIVIYWARMKQAEPETEEQSLHDSFTSAG